MLLKKIEWDFIFPPSKKIKYFCKIWGRNDREYCGINFILFCLVSNLIINIR